MQGRDFVDKWGMAWGLLMRERRGQMSAKVGWKKMDAERDRWRQMVQRMTKPRCQIIMRQQKQDVRCTRLAMADGLCKRHGAGGNK